MATTIFINGVTPVVAEWLNDANDHIYDEIPNPHPQYTTLIADTMSTHIADADPHTQYLKESDASATYATITTVNTKQDSATAVTKTGSTGAAILPVGTNGQRPTPATGYFRFNTDLVKFEGYNGTSWGSVGGGAVGGSTDDAFYENTTTITADYTITTGKNAMSAGPITINPGVTVTVPSGSVWSVI